MDDASKTNTPTRFATNPKSAIAHRLGLEENSNASSPGVATISPPIQTPPTAASKGKADALFQATMKPFSSSGKVTESSPAPLPTLQPKSGNNKSSDEAKTSFLPPPVPASDKTDDSVGMDLDEEADKTGGDTPMMAAVDVAGGENKVSASKTTNVGVDEDSSKTEGEANQLTDGGDSGGNNKVAASKTDDGLDGDDGGRMVRSWLPVKMIASSRVAVMCLLSRAATATTTTMHWIPIPMVDWVMTGL